MGLLRYALSPLYSLLHTFNTYTYAISINGTHSDFMRQQAMSSKMIYARPIPVNRAVNAISDSESWPMSCASIAESVFRSYRGPIQYANVRTTAVRCWIPSRRLRCASDVTKSPCRSIQRLIFCCSASVPSHQYRKPVLICSSSRLLE
jgi:hypothetical protein